MVHDLEGEVLCAEVLLCAEGDRQAYTIYGVRSLAGHNPVEGLVAGSHLVQVEVHLSERLCEDDVQAATPINDGLRQEHPIYYGIVKDRNDKPERGE
jgi:hypothetical protein